jgi:asparagine synthase (glutamine-hydrolysing)
MCGLFGIATTGETLRDSTAVCGAALTLLTHRGPDGEGHFETGAVFSGHRRLAIIDPSDSGKQPMSRLGVTATVNGEIYNFRQLRAELEKTGAIFKSNSDSETVLHGYIEWGIHKLCQKLEGMFAFSVIDLRAKSVFLVRDRVGIKPLYYSADMGKISWGSEISTLIETGIVDGAVDRSAIVDFLVYRYIPSPKTIYEKIRQVPAASILSFDLVSGATSLSEYWKLGYEEEDISEGQFVEAFNLELAASVSQQLVSDVPLGLLLSGGLDSSAIAYHASAQHNLQSFALGFKGSSRDESAAAALVASRLNLNHRMMWGSRSAPENLRELMLDWFGQPFGDTSALPTFSITELASKHVTVALSGDGGDELFGGYTWYSRFERAQRAGKFIPSKAERGIQIESLPRRLQKFSYMFIADPVVMYATIRGALPWGKLQEYIRLLGLPENYDPYWAYREHYVEGVDPRLAAQVMDFHTYLPDDILTKVDRVSMRNSLECRPPFLSTPLIKLAFSTPRDLLYSDHKTKGAMRKALTGKLPREIVNKPKQGFSVQSRGWKEGIASQFGSMQEYFVREFVAREMSS